MVIRKVLEPVITTVASYQNADASEQFVLKLDTASTPSQFVVRDEANSEDRIRVPINAAAQLVSHGLDGQSNPITNLSDLGTDQLSGGITPSAITDLAGTNLSVNSGVLDASGSAIASDMILAWSGTIDNIPGGWVLCDGNNATPNLQDKFIVGAGNTHAVDDTGGESTHTLTNSELASHDHDNSPADDDDSANGSIPVRGGDNLGSLSVGSDGGDSAHENKPPYHALAWIMKT